MHGTTIKIYPRIYLRVKRWHRVHILWQRRLMKTQKILRSRVTRMKVDHVGISVPSYTCFRNLTWNFDVN